MKQFISRNELSGHSFYSDRQQMSLKYHIFFETASWFGRHFLQKLPPKQEGQCYLNLGCGDHPVDGWVNADFFKLNPFGASKANWHVDFRHVLPCNDCYFDGIFTEHTLEHMTPREDHNLLLELFRILKSGGALRISVPDLDKYIRFYLGEIPHEEFRQWESGPEAIRSLTQCWGHRSVWNFPQMKSLLTKIGFVKIRQTGFREGSVSVLNQDRPEHIFESLYIEAFKPAA